LKILAVCGFGVGSSMVLKMTIEKACRKLGIEAEVENTDTASVRGMKCDAIFTSFDLQDSIRKGVQVPVYPIKRYMSIEEVTESILKINIGGNIKWRNFWTLLLTTFLEIHRFY